MENQVFYLQNAVKVIMKKLDDILKNGGIQGPPGRDGVDGIDGESPDLSEYVRRTEIIRASDGNIRIGTNDIDWVKLGMYRFYFDGSILHIADTEAEKEVQLTLNQESIPDIEEST
jgi:hypothetical protein